MLLQTPKDYLGATSRDLITKDLILRTNYEGRRRTSITVFEIPPQIVGNHLAVYLTQYGQILSSSDDDLNRGRTFEIMVDVKAFISIHKCLDVEG